MEEKVTASFSIEKRMKEKIARLSNILGCSESDFIATSVDYFLDKSDVGKKALKKITDNKKYLEGIERGKDANRKHYGGGTILYETK